MSAFCALCKGSVQSKLKYQMLAYTEVIKEDGDQDDPKNICLRLKNLKQYIECILKLALCSSSEILLDYPVDKLAQATAEKCMEFAMVDKQKGMVTLEDVHRFIETANPVSIV